MKYYQEITIINNPELSLFFIWGKLFTQVHLALVEAKNPDDTVNIGISFPEYACFEKNGKTIAILGSKLRVFAKTKAELEQLNLNKWCARLLDYIHIKSITEVSNKLKGYVLVKRVRQENDLDRKTKQRAKKRMIMDEDVKNRRIKIYAEKNNISEEEARHSYDHPILKKLPFIKMESCSNHQKFSLLIEQQEYQGEPPKAGTFSTYGLSSTHPVPHW